MLFVSEWRPCSTFEITSSQNFPFNALKFTAVGLVTVFGFELCFQFIYLFIIHLINISIKRTTDDEKTHGHMDTKEKDQGTTTVRCKIIFVCRCGEHRLITQTKWRHIQQNKRTRILD